MKLGELSASDISRRLRGEGLLLQTGPFVSRIRSKMQPVAEGLSLLYADFPVPDAGGFVDFHVRVDSPSLLRRWYRPQVNFFYDEYQPFKPLPGAQSFAMFEWGMNWCVSAQINTHLIIHSAAVEKNGKVVLLPGEPGAGKSTLCAALVSRGWRLLSDEMAWINPATGKISGLARPVSLKNRSIDIIRDFTPGVVIGAPALDTLKGTVAHMKPPTDSVLRMSEEAAPAFIVYPRYMADTSTSLQKFRKGISCVRFAENAFNFNLLGVPGFELLSDVVDASECYQLIYSDLEEVMGVFDELVMPSALQAGVAS